MDVREVPREEIQSRLEKCRQKMGARGLAGVVLTGETNVQYFTGYRNHAPGTTYTRPLWLLIPASGDPVLLMQTFVVPEGRAKGGIDDVRGFDSLLGSPLGQIADVMRELDMDRGEVGWELGYEQRMGIPYLEFEGLRERMSSARFADASDLLWEIRMIKSEAEIECTRNACRITSQALDQCLREIQAGMTEKEIARRVSALMLENGAEKPGFVIMVSGSENYERISGIATDRRIEKGDLVWLDAGANYQGYWSDFCRAGVVGGPTREQRDQQKLVHDVTMAAVEKIAPGFPVAGVAEECVIQMRKRGIDLSFDCGRMGHGIGLSSTEPPHVAGYDGTILQPGMIITVEPGIVNETGVYDIEENVLVTENGFEILSGASRELYTIRESQEG